MHSLRVNKSEAEIANMRKAGQTSGRVFTQAMRTQLATEKELWASLDYNFKMQGLDGAAYVPVVAGGQVRGIGFHDRCSQRMLMITEWSQHPLRPQ